jgi:hypothetical protein
MERLPRHAARAIGGSGQVPIGVTVRSAAKASERLRFARALSLVRAWP